MVIVEAISDAAIADINNLFDAHVADLGTAEGFVTSHRLTEDGGRMVILETTWKSREACLAYHTFSGRHRQERERLAPFIAGDPLVKLCKRYSYSEAFQTNETVVPSCDECGGIAECGEEISDYAHEEHCSLHPANSVG
jgi:heme-degrading monooxygenase HmoA